MPDDPCGTELSSCGVPVPGWLLVDDGVEAAAVPWASAIATVPAVRVAAATVPTVTERIRR
jgi:hypothetical protein